MRRKDQEITDHNTIVSVMRGCDCCRIGLVEDGGMYIVPMNFGFIDHGDQVTLYFHCAKEGKKLDLLRRQPLIGFEMDRKHEAVEREDPCSCSFMYESIIGKGRMEFLENLEEKRTALQSVLSHYFGKREWALSDDMVEKVIIMKMTVLEWSCKCF